jgi:hypothetical protein
LLDDSVRSTWEIPRSRVKITSRAWKQLLAGYLREAERELGVPEGSRRDPVFDKLLVYEKGQFFKPHQDSERFRPPRAKATKTYSVATLSGGTTHTNRAE